MSDPARFVRQILLAEIGDRGQERIGAATAAVGGPSLAHEVASRYAAGAGFARIAPGEIDVDALAPPEIATSAPAREVLAGARAALAALNSVIQEKTS
jgi:hypothetical protein